MWKRLDAKVRNQVRKAMTSGLTPAWCGIEGLDDFYAVFAQNMRDLGSPVHAKRFFAAILEEFAGDARLLLVRDGSQVVAGGVCMVFRDTVLVPWASSLRRVAKPESEQSPLLGSDPLGLRQGTPVARLRPLLAGRRDVSLQDAVG